MSNKEVNEYKKYLKKCKELLLNSSDKYFMYGDEESEFFRDGNNIKKFHIELLPLQVYGSIDKAKIVFLLENPGYSVNDYYTENYTKIGRKLHKNELLSQYDQKDNEMPYFKEIYINLEKENKINSHKIYYSDGSKWWKAKLNPLIEKILKDSNGKTDEIKIFKWLAKNVVVFELLPYHSKNCPSFTENLKNLESYKKVKECVCALCNNQEKYIFVLRGNNYWKIDGNKSIVITNNNRNISFNVEQPVGKALLNTVNKITNGFKKL